MAETMTGGKKSKKPSSKKPASKKPASKKPASKKPASKKPASKKPVSKKTGSKATNPWLVHVKKTMKENPNLKFKDVLKLAKKTYKK